MPGDTVELAAIEVASQVARSQGWTLIAATTAPAMWGERAKTWCLMERGSDDPEVIACWREYRVAPHCDTDVEFGSAICYTDDYDKATKYYAERSARILLDRKIARQYA